MCATVCTHIGTSDFDNVTHNVGVSDDKIFNEGVATAQNAFIGSLKCCF